MKNSPAFVAFYEANNISPVSQDITDLSKHFQRRESLFRSLGILPALVKGASVLEFGPGSGHNALYTASLLPHRYDLVEGNLKGVVETRARLASLTNSQVLVHHMLFENFRSDSKFDLVWAEGCLPHQTHPLPLLEHVASFLLSGGVLCVSLNNGVSYLSEIMRRLLRDRFFDINQDVHKQLHELIPYLQPHLKHLSSMSRPVEDWIMDSVVQPMRDRRLMSIPDAINCLDNRFDVYGTSPRFLVDWRWYKEIVGVERKFNEIALNDYYKNSLNLLDYRYKFPEHSVDFGMKLEHIGSQSWDLMCRIEYGDQAAWQDFFELMKELCSHIEKSAKVTTMAIQEAVKVLRDGHVNSELKQFSQWWGRGQQYLSLIRRSD
jgi:SAM-dependent methyltransferase